MIDYKKYEDISKVYRQLQELIDKETFKNECQDQFVVLSMFNFLQDLKRGKGKTNE